MEGDFGDGRSDQIHRLFCPFLFVGVNPGTLFTNVGHFKKVGVEACGLNDFTVRGFVHPGRAGGHHHALKTKRPDVVLDQFLPGIGAHILIVASNGDIGQGLSKGRYLVNIHRIRDIDAAMTDIKTDLHNSILSTIPSPLMGEGEGGGEEVCFPLPFIPSLLGHKR